MCLSIPISIYLIYLVAISGVTSVRVTNKEARESLKPQPSARFPLLNHRLEPPKNSPRDQKFLDDILNDRSFDIPEELDWRNVKGRVPPVRHVGNCSSAWAAAGLGALEGQELVRNKTLKDLIQLSLQNLVDCDKTDAGCDYGYPDRALKFIHAQGGIQDEKSYPYEGLKRKCRFNKSHVAFTDSGAAILSPSDEGKLRELVAKFGPVSVSIDAFDLAFIGYKSGIMNAKSCSKIYSDHDHHLLVVGYGSDPKEGLFWILQNSWGVDWGEKGYLRMRRGTNMCGIANAPTIPTFQD